MIPILALAVALLSSPVDPARCAELQRLYARMDRAGMMDLLNRATTREERFLVLYRLFPLESKGSLLKNLPEELEPTASARELALLAALWSYRYTHEGVFGKMGIARRAVRLIDQARAADPDDPYVLLVDGQFLLHKPKIAGGNAASARERFETLVEQLERHPACALSATEARTWLWFSKRRLKDPAAETERNAILASDPPPVFRALLEDAP